MEPTFNIWDFYLRAWNQHLTPEISTWGHKPLESYSMAVTFNLGLSPISVASGLFLVPVDMFSLTVRQAVEFHISWETLFGFHALRSWEPIKNCLYVLIKQVLAINVLYHNGIGLLNRPFRLLLLFYLFFNDLKQIRLLAFWTSQATISIKISNFLICFCSFYLFFPILEKIIVFKIWILCCLIK